MDIVLKESKTGWIKVTDEISVLVGYYNMQQEEKLKQILYEVGSMPEFELKDLEKFTPENKARLMTLNERYFKLFIKFTIKDWKGVKNSKGEEVPFVLLKDEMETGLWESLCRSMSLKDIYELHKMIKKEIEFTETDKKK